MRRGATAFLMSRWLSVAVSLAAACGVVAVRVGDPVALTVAWASIAFALGMVIMRDPIYGLYAMLLALPLEVAGQLTPGASQMITLYHVTLVLTLIAWGVHRLRGTETAPFRFSLLHAGLLALVGAAVWSLPFSQNPSATGVATIRLAFLFLFFSVFEHFAREERTMRRVLAVLTGTAAVFGAVALLQFLFPSLNPGDTHPLLIGGHVLGRPAAFFVDPNYLAGFLSVGAVVALGRSLHARTLREAAPWLLGAFVSAAGLVATLSRTGWVGVVLGAVICAVTAPRTRRPRAVAVLLVAAVLVVVFAPGIVLERLRSIGDVQEDPSISTRVAMLASTVEIIRDHPIFGTGLAAFDEVYPAYRDPDTLVVFRPHEIPLALPAEMGIMGLLAEALIVAGVIQVFVQRRRRAWTAWESAALSGLACLALQSLFQYYLYFEYLWLMPALFLAADRMSQGVGSDTPVEAK